VRTQSPSSDLDFAGPVVALIAAAGSGERLGAAEPKALVQCGGQPLLAWSLAACFESKVVDRVVVAAPVSHLAQVSELVSSIASDNSSRVVVTAGADSRSGSVKAALASAVETFGQPAIVVVNDAARPLVSGSLIDACVAALGDADAVVAAAPVVDTIKQTGAGNVVVKTLDRASLWAAQTPQAYRYDVLASALAVPDDQLKAATDDALLVERAGGVVKVFSSVEPNPKVTTAFDLAAVELMIGSGSS